VKVEAGDILDFVVEPRESAAYDSFKWSTRIRLLEADIANLLRSEWSAAADFGGPGAGTVEPLDAWERYAHVLLQSNELVFLD
jgi:hypothetical protein